MVLFASLVRPNALPKNRVGGKILEDLLSAPPPLLIQLSAGTPGRALGDRRPLCPQCSRGRPGGAAPSWERRDHPSPRQVGAVLGEGPGRAPCQPALDLGPWPACHSCSEPDVCAEARTPRSSSEGRPARGRRARQAHVSRRPQRAARGHHRLVSVTCDGSNFSPRDQPTCQLCTDDLALGGRVPSWGGERRRPPCLGSPRPQPTRPLTAGACVQGGPTDPRQEAAPTARPPRSQQQPPARSHGHRGHKGHAGHGHTLRSRVLSPAGPPAI